MVDFSCHDREPLKLHARCRTCSRIYMREWQTRHAKRVAEYQREYRERNLEATRRRGREYQAARRADPKTADLVREQMHRSWQKMRNDPKRWAERLDAQRMNYRIKAEREGRTVRQVGENTYANGNGAVPLSEGGNLFPVGPIAELISEWLGEFGGQPLSQHEWNGGGFGAGYTQLAELTGVDERTLARCVNGERQYVQYATADAICAVLGTSIGAVYS